jgi:hypothetical protein
MRRDWRTYVARAQEVSIFQPDGMQHLKYTYNITNAVDVVWEQIKRSLLMFHYYVDRSAHFSYPHPMFNSLISPLLVLGLGFAGLRWRTPGTVLILSSFGLILVLGGILTINAPTWTRLVGLMPLASVLIAVALDQLWDFLERFGGQRWGLLLSAGVGAYLVIVGIKDWGIYYRDVSEYARPIVRVGRYLNSLPSGVAACGFLDKYAMDWSEIQFMGWPRQLVDMHAGESDTELDTCPAPPVVWIFSPKYANRLDEARARWPDGVIEDHLDLEGEIVFTSFLVNR